jgi:glycosyltransferase involved in cell wall biosynthesis
LSRKLENSFMRGITLLICTYNGAKRLPETMRHLAAQQTTGDFAWEIVLVSNASTDDTLTAAPKIWAALGTPAPLRLFDEPRVGKENALVKGLDEAAYECICIVDDDNWLYPDYISRVMAIMDVHPQIGVLGGYAEGAFEVTPPVWFEQFKSYYAVGAQATRSGPITQPRAYIYGAGSVIRRSGWQHLRANGFAFTTSTKRGKIIVSGEDVELGNALKLAGYQLWYDEGLRLRHFMYKERLNWPYLQRMARGASASAPTELVYEYLIDMPEMDWSIFHQRYLRDVAWLGRHLLGRHRHNSHHTGYTGIAWNVNKFRSMLNGRHDIERIFSQTKKLQQALRANPSPVQQLGNK